MITLYLYIQNYNHLDLISLKINITLYLKPKT